MQVKHEWHATPSAIEVDKIFGHNVLQIIDETMYSNEADNEQTGSCPQKF